MIILIFSPKNLAFLTENKAKLCKILIITLVFWEKRQFFFAENCQKLQKIVIITSTPGAECSQNFHLKGVFTLDNKIVSRDRRHTDRIASNMVVTSRDMIFIVRVMVYLHYQTDGAVWQK
jgi:hypothetical protein